MTVENSYFAYGILTDPVDLTVSVSSNSDRILGINIITRGAGDVVSSVTLDPGGNDETATLLQSSNTGATYAYTYYIVNPTSGADQTLRVDLTTSSVQVTVHVLDMSGMDTTSIDDNYNISSGTSTDPSVTWTTSNSGSHIQSSMLSEANSGSTVDTWSGVTGQTNADETDRGGFQTASAYATQTSSGSITADFSTTESSSWIAIGVAWATESTTDTLTASDVASGTPTLDLPLVAEEGTDPLSASDVTSGTPALDTPTLTTNVNDLTASDVTSGTPTLDTPTISEDDPPTVALNTADSSSFGSTPTLEFTGTDLQGDDVRYQIQISAETDFADNTAIADSNTATQQGIIHPNPRPFDTTWEGEIQVDDRPGQSFTGEGGMLDHISFEFGPDTDTDGDACIRVYAHQGTFGTSSEPLNPADAEDTPTPNWLAKSTVYPFTTSFSLGWHEFYFTGDNRITLEDGTYYVLIFDWIPNDTNYDNTVTTRGSASTGHDGNCYIDGDSVNNGVFSSLDMRFRVYESTSLLEKVSGTDAGFVNTENGGDTDPFTSGQKISFTVQAGDALDAGIYYWRVRALDPSGTNTWGAWSTSRSFTVSDGDDDLTASDITSGTPTIDYSVLLNATFLRPSSDITVGNWESTEVTLYQALDEEVASDVDYINSEISPSSSLAEVRYQSGSDPSRSDFHIVHYRYGKIGGGTINITFYLMEGTTQIATWSHNDVSEAETTDQYVLSESEANSITDYTNLRIRFVATEV